jgi:hypothetical protein
MLVRFDERTRELITGLLHREHRPSTPELRPQAGARESSDPHNSAGFLPSHQYGGPEGTVLTIATMNDAAPVHASKHAEPDSRFDTSVAQPARVYDYWLGGKDCYEADRKAAEDVIRLRPQVIAGARANRAYLARVVRYLAADCGVRQFLDIGAGLPFPDNTHDVAQRSRPTAGSPM